MKKTSIILSVLTMAALLMAGCGDDSGKAATMRFLRADGEAWISDEEQKNLDVAEGMSLYSGYGVGTSAHANAWLTLDEATTAKMDFSSEIGIKRSEDGKQLEVDVKSGKMYFNVAEPLKDDESLDIETSTMTVGIRGTAGWVESHDDYSIVAILEGHVALTAKNGGDSVILGEGYMATLFHGRGFEVEQFSTKDVPEFVMNEEDTVHMLETLGMNLDASANDTETKEDSPDSKLPYDPKAGLELPEIPDDGIAREVIEVADNEAFQSLLASGRDLSNTEIRLGDGEYKSDYGLAIGAYENVSIIGTGKTRIVVDNGGATVLDSYGSKNLLLYGLVLGHDIPPMDECSMGVLSFFGCENVSVVGCDIYGCGLVGIEASSDVTITDSVIRECSYSAVQTYSDCTVHFVNSIIQDNDGPYLFVSAEGSKFLFDDCTIQGNHSNAEFAPMSDGMEPDVTMNNTTEKNNAWQ